MKARPARSLLANNISVYVCRGRLPFCSGGKASTKWLHPTIYLFESYRCVGLNQVNWRANLYHHTYLCFTLLPVYPLADRPSWSASSVLFRVLANLRLAWASHFLPSSAAICQSSVTSFLPSFLPAHFAAFCSLYSLTPAVAANSLPRSLPPLKNNTLVGNTTSSTCSMFKTLGLLAKVLY